MKFHELLWMVIAIVAAACWNGCSNEPAGFVRGVYNVPPERREQFAGFMIECARAANPHSDEEGEDLVAQCEQTGRRTFGDYVRQWCPEGGECFSCSGRNLHRGGCR